MRTIIFTVIVIFNLHSFEALATSTYASSFGFNPVNATAAFQAAVLSNNDTIIVDIQNADWNVGPSLFNNINNKTIIFQPNVVFKALPGFFNNTQACLLKFTNSSNISLIGYGAILKMNKNEYMLLDDSEYRMSISFEGSSNISIKGFIIDESGGDGIYIGGNSLQYCENVFIEDVQCINHYRQGMSITNVQNMTVKNSYFMNTQGTLPEAGIDVEPYQTTQRIVNLNIENCRFENNGWSGIALALFELDSTSVPVSISIKDCVFKNNCQPSNSYAHCEIFISADKSIPVQGSVLFERCLIEESQYGAFYTRKTADAFHVTFKDCVFQNVSQLPIQYNEPIFLEVPDYSNPSSYLGGLNFDNVFVSYNTNFNFFRVFGWTTLAGIQDITGNFTVVEPNNNPVLYSNVPDTINCSFQVNNYTSLPNTTITNTIVNPDATECDQKAAVFKVLRASTNISYPLGISYTVAGSAELGNDVHLPPMGIVIPSYETERIDSIYARQDNIIESPETLIFNFQTSPFYSISGSNLAVFNVLDCFSLNINEENSDLNWRVFPNPTSGNITIENQKNEKLVVSVYTLVGVKIFSSTIYQTEVISISNLPSNMYYLTINREHMQIFKTFKVIKY